MVSRIDWNKPLPQSQLEDGDDAQQVRKLEHLLKVAANINKDACTAWAQVWSEMDHLVTPGGMILPQAKDGFVPACGWPEFFEKLWTLKHYLDSAGRICSDR